jgi:hypothetical protein
VECSIERCDLPWFTPMNDLERVVSVIHSLLVKAQAEHKHKIPQLEARVKSLTNTKGFTAPPTVINQDNLQVCY